jgi:hypothetical protein
MPVDHLIELELAPEPAAQPNVAEATRMGPAHGYEADPNDIGIIGQVALIVVREQTPLAIFSLSIMKDDFSGKTRTKRAFRG